MKGIASYEIRTIDDFGRLLIPDNMRHAFDVQLGDEVIIGLDRIGRKLYLNKTVTNSMVASSIIDDHGRIEISPGLQREVRWRKGEKIAIVNLSDDQLILKSEEKFYKDLPKLYHSILFPQDESNPLL